MVRKRRKRKIGARRVWERKVCEKKKRWRKVNERKVWERKISKRKKRWRKKVVMNKHLLENFSSDSPSNLPRGTEGILIYSRFSSSAPTLEYTLCVSAFAFAFKIPWHAHIISIRSCTHLVLLGEFGT